MILKQRTEEEIEAVRRVLEPQVALTGFYSYGEISPHTSTAKCELHNQTMTITTFWEE
ncbi:FIST C-terminal domain-containing protein [Saccharophagus degradans]|uniref:FIST C-terminal domain-containing protein n=1 Tax=Saccharophagus degradans TaxID=86304 RepID=UPI001C0A09B7|nr:FIST C-terminal domain-containing protein [Saccharophagus degradans]MBU2985573.1 FIST C-terminal domain-containing protein [Saccharophagus degradans]